MVRDSQPGFYWFQQDFEIQRIPGREALAAAGGKGQRKVAPLARREALSNAARSGQPARVSKKPSGVNLRPRLRVICGENIALGPGKVDLLRLVGETGSIREAAERMGMSYMRAWTLIKTMNACFKEPLVEAVRGGSKHGGAKLTETGRNALKLYHEMEGDCLRATNLRWKRLKGLLQDS